MRSTTWVPGSEGRTAGQLPSRLWAWQSLTEQEEYGAVMCFEYVQTNVKFWSLPSGYDIASSPWKIGY